MIYFRELGFNFAALTIFDFMGNDVVPILNNVNIQLDRCLHNSFKMDYEYEYIYIDFDDTIIVDKKVNSTAMKFLYQCINKNKKIFLLTRHEKEIMKSLKMYHIDVNIFDEIIHIDESELKSDKIKYKNSVFIDNYFRERYEVFNKLNIPVFDVDAIECLIDDSEI